MMKSLDSEIETLKKWDAAYYDGTPLVADAVYDSERDRILKRIAEENPDHPYLSEVGAAIPDGGAWAKFKHTSVMGSLQKVNTKEELTKWAQTRGKSFFVAEKVDGWTLAAYYEDGKLQTLATRGDGVEGEDITANAKYFQNLKLNLPGFSGILRGEAMLHLDDFEKHFAPLGTSNCRNAVAKIRDTKNPELKQHITVKWFDIICDTPLKTWGEKFKYIESLGLETSPHYDNEDVKGIWDVYQDYVAQKRKSLNYWIDGLVIRISDCEKHDSFGVTDNRPKGSVALKFPTNGVQSVLLGVEFNRGKSGRISVVGLIQPVLIDGTTVSRVSLHGQDWINELELQINDVVEVAKAGDIIPQIIRKISGSSNSKPIVFPSTCPDCKEKVVKNGAYIQCVNPACHGELVGSIGKWLEKTGIKGIGDSILVELAKDIKDVSDLYTAPVEVFAKAAKGSEKIAKKIQKEIDKTRNLPLAIFLSALHIDTLGDTNGQRLAEHFKTLDKVLAAKEDDIRGLKGIDANAGKIHGGIQEKRELITKLAGLINIEGIVQGSFSGSSFCITGKLNSGKKREAVEAWIKEQGGTVLDGVSKGLTYLITDTPDSGSSKNQKADSYGVKKITEAQLYEILNAKDPGSNAPPKRIPVKKIKEASIFDLETEEAAWVEVSGNNGKFTIVKTDITDSPAKLAFFKNGVVVSNIKVDDVEVRQNKITAKKLEDVENALSQLLFTVEV